MNVDEWIPNWNLFVLTLLPALLLFFFLTILYYRGMVFWKWRRWLKANPDPSEEANNFELFKVLSYLPYAYLVFPLFRIWNYLMDELSFLDLVDGLFTEDFKGFMVVALCVGCIQAMGYLIMKGKLFRSRSAGGE